MKYNDALDKLLEETASSFFGDMDEEPKETVISKAPTTSGEQIFSDKEYRYALENKALPKYRLYLEKKNRKDSPAYLHCRKLEQDLLDVYFRYENTKEWFLSQQEILVPAIDCYLSDAEKRITRARSFDPEFADELQQEEGPAMLYLTQILDFLTSGELPDETVVQAPESSGKINVALLSTALSSYSLQLEVFRKPGAPDYRKCMELSKMLINTYFDQDPSAQWFEENRMFVEPAVDELISSYYDALLSADPEETNTALINRRREDANHLRERLLPPLQAFFTALDAAPDVAGMCRAARQYLVAMERLFMAASLQYTLPGSPSLYYGDEAAMEGGRDPFNRRTYPWGKENQTLVEFFRALGRLRKENEALRLGDIRFFQAGDQRIGFTRTYGGKTVRVYINRSCDAWDIPAGRILLGHNLRTVAPNWLTISPMGVCILEEEV